MRFTKKVGGNKKKKRRTLSRRTKHGGGIFDTLFRKKQPHDVPNTKIMVGQLFESLKQNKNKQADASFKKIRENINLEQLDDVLQVVGKKWILVNYFSKEDNKNAFITSIIDNKIKEFEMKIPQQLEEYKYAQRTKLERQINRELATRRTKFHDERVRKDNDDYLSKYNDPYYGVGSIDSIDDWN